MVFHDLGRKGCRTSSHILTRCLGGLPAAHEGGGEVSSFKREAKTATFVFKTIRNIGDFVMKEFLDVTTVKKIALEVAKREGGRKEVDIAQITEIVSEISDIVYESQGAAGAVLYKNGERRAKLKSKKRRGTIRGKKA